jgi:hypothetical protein
MRQDEYRAYVERIVLHALTVDPKTAWTRQTLAAWYDLRLDVVEQVLEDLTEAGTIRRVPASLEAYERAPALRAVV